MLNTSKQIPPEINQYLKNLYQPDSNSHKGQNGKLLTIGGSQLFHSSIFWAADAASRMVDMVHFTSLANENNALVRFKLKQGFWNGIVVDWSEVEGYIEEDDAILIGPGMDRSKETEQIVNQFLQKFPNKKWVIDGGALQMIDLKLLGKTHIITPHQGELERLKNKTTLQQLIKQGVTILAKGKIDYVFPITSSGEANSVENKIPIVGGNPGMTKGGTGDVLAGVVAALYCLNDAVTSAVVGSYLTKQAGDRLWQTKGQFFNAGDLVKEIGLNTTIS